MDIVSPATRSRMMAGIRSANTRPEIIVRSILHTQGFRYRLGTKVLNIVPDIVLPKYKVAIFVHGCFWHRHEGCKYATTPKTHTEKWAHKFDANTLRDSQTVKTLTDAGWRLVAIWECWTKRKLDISWLYSWIKMSDCPYIFWPETDDFILHNVLPTLDKCDNTEAKPKCSSSDLI
ncbi:MAG: very short patch repair endonuclease [Desulfovibrio sp.]|jgi:DNA mismatch endonuclease (patch repair protein)|nr:very short patch repair endonuclease [Desulfovibrio sp.]